MKFNTEQIKKEFNSFLTTHVVSSEPKLISFSFIFDSFDSSVKINCFDKIFSDIFLFHTPNRKLKVIGFDSALELTSAKSNNLISTNESYSHWRKNLISNWKDDYQLNQIICCTAKFDSHNNSQLWTEFDPIRIYIPEFMIISNSKATTAYFNFISENSTNFDNIWQKLQSYLNTISKSATELNEPGIINSSLNTLLKDDDSKNWNNLVEQALDELKNGKLQKLVLSRSKSFKLDSSPDWDFLLNRLQERFPDCYLFFIKKNNSVFFGSSPEMFLKVTDNVAEVESVAGSAPRGEKFDYDAELERTLKTSKKNHQEHLFVSNFISDILFKYSDNVRIIEEKQIRKLDNIQHLITRISAELNSKENLFELIDSLFPTPAVCGVPKELAMNLIRKLEPHDRGLYSGIVGIFGFDGNCELAVSIRSALIKNNQVTAFAGAGLVRDSDSHEEFLETNLKLNTILSLFTDENKS
jgi:menaquinone-specific isochorismate synthase